MEEYLLLKKQIDRRLKLFFDKKINQNKKISSLMQSIIKHQRDFILQGGKRIRPILIYLGYLAGGGRNKKLALDTSILIELIHGYLIIHDDIIDQDKLRRGQQTLHMRYKKVYQQLTDDGGHLGTSLAIVAGDILCMYGYEVLAQSQFSDPVKIKALRKLNGILADVTMGQTMDILNSTRQPAKLKDILKVLEYKTARYTIEGPLHLGAILAGANQKIMTALSQYAIGLGIAFQIQDDILGMFGDEEKSGKSTSSDLRQHKQTLLIFKAKQYANPKQKKLLAQIMGAKNISLKQVKQVRQIIEETGSLKYSQKLAAKLATQSKQSLKNSPLPLKAKEFLQNLADFIISREK